MSTLLLPSSSLCLALLELGTLLAFGNLASLAGDLLLHGLELGIFSVAVGALGSSFRSILLVRFGTLDALSVCRFRTDLRCSQFTDLVFDGTDVDKVLENSLGILVDTCSIQGSINQSDSLSTVEGQELSRISFDFRFGDFEDGLVDLISVLLRGIGKSITPGI